MKITPLGDSAVAVDFADEFADRDKLLARALSAADAIERAKIPGVVDVTSAYQSVAIFFDLMRIEEGISIEDKIHSAIGSAKRRSSNRRRTIEIPVCYDADFALDLARVAAETRLSADAIITLHSSAKYTVACIGFMPGFPYLAGLDEKLRVPRLATPRTKVPVGSVAFANAQAGIYPFESPGGWNVIGRTPLRLFDANASPPALLRAGDRVSFRRINREEFEKFLSVGRGTAESKSFVDSTKSRPIVSLLSAGFQTTVQDCGRVGFRKFGVATGGAFDVPSLRLANLLVGNEECWAGLEIGSGRVRVRFNDERLIAWAGGEFSVLIGDNTVPPLHCARVSAGTIGEIQAKHGRAWLAISGGIDLPEILGSRSTDLRARFGGLNGRALRDGDELPLEELTPLGSRIAKQIRERVSTWSAPLFATPTSVLRIIPGRNWKEFDGGMKFLESTFRVAMNSDRMGVRLEGVEIESIGRELVSEAVAPGTIQLPSGGAPIVLLADCQTIGGYPKIAHVITVDLARAAQLQPLDEVRFEMITLEQAQKLLRERERDIGLFRAGLEARFG